QLQQEKLVGRVLELNGLDPQTGLPHRSHFLERLDRQIEIAAVKKQDLLLTILGISGLGRHAVSHGQAATRELLRSLSMLLLQNSPETWESWEIGHVSYGIFALSAPGEEEEKMDKAILMFKKRLLDVFGQSGFSCHQARVVSPKDGTKPEALLEAALTALAEAAA
ncbi:MAG: GGDEF domain-containing protein, partial [Deltaproteobacteria bacterium]|nr:GGDEF domain-containing protein [Deltaproteobacteria bacterium]